GGRRCRCPHWQFALAGVLCKADHTRRPTCGTTSTGHRPHWSRAPICAKPKSDRKKHPRLYQTGEGWFAAPAQGSEPSRSFGPAHPALQDPQPLPEYSALCAHHRQKRQPWFQEPTVQPEGCRQSPLHCPVPVRAERECLQAQDFSERRRGYVTTTHC